MPMQSRLTYQSYLLNSENLRCDRFQISLQFSQDITYLKKMIKLLIKKYDVLFGKIYPDISV